MKAHELKLDIKYFDEVKSGKKNFEIRKNDRDYQIGDVLNLKAYVGQESAEEESLDVGYAWTEHLFEEGYDIWENCEEELADTIKVKVVYILSANDVNEGIELMGGDPTAHATINGQVLVLSKVEEVLKDYFNAERLPNDHVVLGIEVVK